MACDWDQQVVRVQAGTAVTNNGRNQELPTELNAGHCCSGDELGCEMRGG